MTDCMYRCVCVVVYILMHVRVFEGLERGCLEEKNKKVKYTF